MADGTQTHPYEQGSARSQPRSALRGAVPISRELLETDGKTIRYEVTPASMFLREPIPSARCNGPDGEVQYVGLSEMRAARDAMILACSMAEVAS